MRRADILPLPPAINASNVKCSPRAHLWFWGDTEMSRSAHKSVNVERV